VVKKAWKATQPSVIELIVCRYGEVKDDFKVKVMQHSMDNAEALHEDDLLTFIYLSTPEEVDNVVNLANQ